MVNSKTAWLKPGAPKLIDAVGYLLGSALVVAPILFAWCIEKSKREPEMKRRSRTMSVSRRLTSWSLGVMLALSSACSVAIVGWPKSADAEDRDVDLDYLKGLASKLKDLDSMQFRALTTLDLSGTSIDDNGLVHLKGLHELAILNLSDTKAGQGSKNLGQLARLREVRLDRTRTEDADLENISNIGGLMVLSLERTDVTDNGMKHLARLRELLWLNLNRTRVGSAGLSNLSSLTNVTVLSLADSLVDDIGIISLKKMEKLRSLDLSGSRVSDEGVSHLRNFESLKSLNLSETQVTNLAISHIVMNKKLTSLFIRHTEVNDKCLDSIRKMKELSFVDLSETKVSEEGVRRLKRDRPELEIVVTVN